MFNLFKIWTILSFTDVVYICSMIVMCRNIVGNNVLADQYIKNLII